MNWWLLLLANILLAYVVVQNRRYRLPAAPPSTSELPTLSLLLPARNETHAITRALQAALRLDYPKLEIIVLDDESLDNTSEKIRTFAHRGIRFIRGQPLPPGWVGKNWACAQLAQAASGQYLLFCDIDVRFNTASLHQLVQASLSSRAAGASVLPRLILQRAPEALLAPLLNWLTLLLPGTLGGLPPAYGGFLLFKAAAYSEHGGFARYRSEILPEFLLARDFRAHQGGWNFYRSGSDLSLSVHKKISSLLEARLRYLLPLHLLAPGIAAAHLLLCLLPLLGLFNLWAYCVIALAFALATRPQLNYWWLAALGLPLVAICELGLLVVSWFEHTLGRIGWKQRQL